MTNEPLQYGRYYHIYNRGNNGENLFVQQRNFPYFLQLYAKHIQPVAETFAYCLLPNHFHFAIRTRSEEEQEAYYRDQIGSFFLFFQKIIGVCVIPAQAGIHTPGLPPARE